MITIPWLQKPKTSLGLWPLDKQLLQLGKNNPWTIRDALNDVLILGLKGSGKSSGPGQLLAKKYLEAGFGGLVVCAQVEEAAIWRSYLKKAGREGDGRFFFISGEYRTNVLEYESGQEGSRSTENLTALLMSISISRKPAKASVSDNSEFWLLQKKKLIRNCITLLKLAGEPVKLRNLYRLMISAPQDIAQVRDASWQRDSYVAQLLDKCAASTNPDRPILNFFWLNEWAASKERRTIEGDFSGMLDSVARGELAELFDTETNLTPNDIENGAVVVIDIPLLLHDELGRFAASLWIQMFMRAMNRRTYTAPSDRPVFLWMDESQYFCSDRDARFQTTSRHKGVSVVRMTQTIPNFRENYGSQDSVDALLGGHCTKVFCRNDDPVTTKWCSEVIGKEEAYKHSISAPASGGAGGMNASTDEKYACPPREFLQLRNGGLENDYVVDGIIFQSGRTFEGQRWMRGHFSQKP